MNAEYHVDLTKTVLAEHFSPDALEQVVAANLGQDSLASLFGNASYRHFCDEAIHKSTRYVESEHRLIASLCDKPDSVGKQRAALGRLLHTVQDFYAHSNYVDLWLEENGGLNAVEPENIDGLDARFLNHPRLCIGDWVLWRDLIYYVPLIGSLAKRIWLPAHSHEAMNLDSPSRGPQFMYALTTARQRTMREYERAVASVRALGGLEAVVRFHGG